MPRLDIRQQSARRTPEDMLAHLRSFSLDLKFSAGIWCFSPPSSRFHAKYKPDLSIEDRLEIAAGLKQHGLAALEAHYPNEINEENVGDWKQFTKKTGIRVLTVIPLLFWDEQFEFGSLSNPLTGERQTAIERLKASLALNKELDTDFAVVWPGIDGYENGFGLDFVAARDRFIRGLAEAMDSVPGVRIAIEPKPYEPRGRILVGTTAEGILACREVESLLRHPDNVDILEDGHSLCAMNPEIGHVLMGYEDLPSVTAWIMAEGRLAHTHCNSQPLGNYDQDLNVGVVSPELLEAWMYTLKMYGYRGYFGIDINPERMPIDTAVRISMDAMRAANERIESLDHEAILNSHAAPHKNRGWLEGYLLRARAPHPEKLGKWFPARA